MTFIKKLVLSNVFFAVIILMILGVIYTYRRRIILALNIILFLIVLAALCLALKIISLPLTALVRARKEPS